MVRAKGTVSGIESRAGDLQLTIRSSDLQWQSYQRGESFCINGVCLTVVQLYADGFAADISQETMHVTALAGLAAGDRVNIEPSLALNDRLGGHLVSGHVDCVGVVSRLRKEARSLRLEIDIPGEFMRYLARKGSVCVDGVSLTINAVSASTVTLNIIPHTVDSTIIGGYRVGTKVNIEVDLLARYVERLLTRDSEGISMNSLREHGYAK
jgi:riboflavin synthase